MFVKLFVKLRFPKNIFRTYSEHIQEGARSRCVCIRGRKSNNEDFQTYLLIPEEAEQEKCNTPNIEF